MERWAAVSNGIVAQEYLLDPKETLRISLFTDQGRTTWLQEPARSPMTFGAVRDQVVLVVRTDSDRIRVTSWNSRGKKHERSFLGLSCGPTMFVTDEGLFVPPCAYFKLEYENSWRMVTTTVSDSGSDEATLLADLEKRYLAPDFNVWHLDGFCWFVTRSKGRVWLVTNRAMSSQWEGTTAECTIH